MGLIRACCPFAEPTSSKHAKVVILYERPTGWECDPTQSRKYDNENPRCNNRGGTDPMRPSGGHRGPHAPHGGNAAVGSVLQAGGDVRTTPLLSHGFTGRAPSVALPRSAGDCDIGELPGSEAGFGSSLDRSQLKDKLAMIRAALPCERHFTRVHVRSHFYELYAGKRIGQQRECCRKGQRQKTVKTYVKCITTNNIRSHCRLEALNIIFYLHINLDRACKSAGPYRSAPPSRVGRLFAPESPY